MNSKYFAAGVFVLAVGLTAVIIGYILMGIGPGEMGPREMAKSAKEAAKPAMRFHKPVLFAVAQGIRSLTIGGILISGGLALSIYGWLKNEK